jgi:hypothetical protein
LTLNAILLVEGRGGDLRFAREYLAVEAVSKPPVLIRNAFRVVVVIPDVGERRRFPLVSTWNAECLGRSSMRKKGGPGFAASRLSGRV